MTGVVRYKTVATGIGAISIVLVLVAMLTGRVRPVSDLGDEGLASFLTGEARTAGVETNLRRQFCPRCTAEVAWGSGFCPGCGWRRPDFFEPVAMVALPADPVATKGTEPTPRQQNAAGKKFIEGHWLGLEVIPLNATLAELYDVPPGQKGVLVDEITLEAAESGILAGDVVQAIEKDPTPDLKAFFVATQGVQSEDRARVTVSRRGLMLTFEMEARNTKKLGFAQMEAAQPIQPRALSPHRARGQACTTCHIIMKTGGQLPTDAGDILPTPPPITRGATPRHGDRGVCSYCHVVR